MAVTALAPCGLDCAHRRSAQPSKNIAAQILVLQQLAEMLIDIGPIDDNGLPGVLGRTI